MERPNTPRRIILKPSEGYRAEDVPPAKRGCAGQLASAGLIIMLLSCLGWTVLHFMSEERVEALRRNLRHEKPVVTVVLDDSPKVTPAPLPDIPIWESETVDIPGMPPPKEPTPVRATAKTAPVSVPPKPVDVSTQTHDVVKTAPRPTAPSWDRPLYDKGVNQFNEAVRMWKQFQQDPSRTDLLPGIAERAEHALAAFEAVRGTHPPDLPLDQHISQARSLAANAKKASVPASPANSLPALRSKANNIVGPQRRPPPGSTP